MKLPPFKLERYFAKYEFKAPYLLCSSDCEALAVNDLLAFESEAEEGLKKHWLGYTESQGSPVLRDEISRLYEAVVPEEVLVHAGAEEAIFNFMNVALEPGDHVIVHFPCYQSLLAVAESIGCEVTKWTTKEEDGWELDLSFLEENIRPNTKVIIINCPHNPTGYLIDKKKFGQLVEIARKYNTLLFSDEVYRLLEHKKEDRLPAACDVYENAVSLGVMSKSFGLAGLRIGWMATKNKDVYSGMASFKDYTSICNSAPSEFLATLALKHKEKVLDRNMDIIKDNLRLLNQFFSTYSERFNWQQPIAGPIAFPSLKTGEDIEQFCVDVVKKTGVLLLPSNYYDFGNKNFRIGFGRKNMSKAIEKLAEYLNKQKNEST